MKINNSDPTLTRASPSQSAAWLHRLGTPVSASMRCTRCSPDASVGRTNRWRNPVDTSTVTQLHIEQTPLRSLVSSTTSTRNFVPRRLRTTVTWRWLHAGPTEAVETVSRAPCLRFRPTSMPFRSSQYAECGQSNRPYGYKFFLSDVSNMYVRFPVHACSSMARRKGACRMYPITAGMNVILTGYVGNNGHTH